MSRTKASARQLSFLAEYMSNHPELGTGYVGSSLRRRAELENQWLSLTKRLNSLGGPIKTVIKWKQTWRDLKNSVKRKAAHNNELNEHESGNTCNDPSPLHNVTETEDHVVSVLAPPAINGLVDVFVTKSELIEPHPTWHTGPEMHSPGLSEVTVLPVLPEAILGTNESANPGQPPKKKMGTFYKKMIQIEEEKLKNQKEKNNLLQIKNEILEKKNDILENKNAALNRLGDIFQEIFKKLNE